MKSSFRFVLIFLLSMASHISNQAAGASSSSAEAQLANETLYQQTCYKKNGERKKTQQCSDWEKRINTQIYEDEKVLAQECENEKKSYDELVAKSKKACSKVLTGYDFCIKQVKECEGKDEDEKRGARAYFDNDKEKKNICALKSVRQIPNLKKQTEKYDDKVQTSKERIKELERDIKEKFEETQSLEADLEEKKNEIKNFFRELKAAGAEKLSEAQQKALSLQDNIYAAEQAFDEIKAKAELSVDEFNQKILEIEINCNQKATDEFKAKEREYQQRKSQMISSGQYRTQGFGLFFGKAKAKQPNSENAVQRREYRDYLEKVCTESKANLALKNQYERAKIRVQEAVNKASTSTQQTIAKMKQDLSNLQTDAANTQEFYEEQQDALKALQTQQSNTQKRLNLANQEMQKLRSELQEAETDLTNNKRLQNTLEESINDREELARNKNAEPGAEVSDINSIFEHVLGLENAKDYAASVCNCQPVKSRSDESSIKQDIVELTPKKNLGICKLLKPDYYKFNTSSKQPTRSGKSNQAR